MPYLRATWAGRWDYLPSEAPRMFSETGPLADRAGAIVPDATKCLSSLSNGVLAMAGGHGLAFGKANGADDHEDFLGLSVVRAGNGSVRLAEDDAEDGDVVAVLWPSGVLMPGRVRVSGWRRAVELPASPPDGDRFFVLDEDGSTLITVGLPSDSVNMVRLLPRIAMVSWLVAVKSPAAAGVASRFVVEEVARRSSEGEPMLPRVVASDTKTGRRYEVGACGQKEMDDVRWSLAVGGLAGIAGRYDVEVMGCQS
jgi:hypothetical protein